MSPILLGGDNIIIERHGRLMASGQPLSSGQKTPSCWGVPIINTSMSRSFMVGKVGMSIFGAVQEIKVMSGL